MCSKMETSVTIQEALNMLLHATWPIISIRVLPFRDTEMAWKLFIKVNYQMIYANLLRNGILTQARVEFDVNELVGRIRHMDNDILADNIQASVIACNKEAEVLPPPSDYDMAECILDDFMQQAFAMCNIVIRYANRYDPPVTEQIIDMRIKEIGTMLEMESETLGQRFNERYRRIVACGEHAKGIIRGEEEPMDYESILSWGYQDMITHRNLVDSVAWHWWVGAYQFMAGQREGQDGYDIRRQEELEMFALLAPDAYGQNAIEYDPYDVVKNSRPAMHVPGYCLQDEISKIRNATCEDNKNWYAKFKQLDWCEEPDDETLDGYLRALDGR